jgi:hypothetical protein
VGCKREIIMKLQWMLCATLLLLASCAESPQPASETGSSAEPGAKTLSDLDSASAHRFLAQVYAGYHLEAALDAQLPEDQVYAPTLLMAMQANRDAYAGEVGYLDVDPLCACQDMAQDLRHLVFDIQPLADEQLSASTQLDGPQQPLALRLSLQRHGNSWRIADITTADEPSLRLALERDTAAAATQQD